jgi:CRP-like cAMP-binding protein
VLRVARAGDHSGEIGPLFSLPRSATVRARTDAAVTGYSVPGFPATPRRRSCTGRRRGARAGHGLGPQEVFGSQPNDRSASSALAESLPLPLSHAYGRVGWLIRDTAAVPL